jgi:hypothetical protein
MGKGTIGLFGMIAVGLIVLTVTLVFHALPLTLKVFKINSDARLFLEINDQSGKIVPALRAKTGDMSNTEIFACMMSGVDCGQDDLELERLARDMDSKFIVYLPSGEEQAYGSRHGDTLYTDIPLPGGRRGQIGIVIDATIKQRNRDKEYTSAYGNCFDEGEDNYRRNHLVTIDFMGKDVDVNIMAAADFRAVAEDIKKCPDEETKNYDFWREPGGGTYVCRMNRNDPDKMSMHAYGLAIDINPQSNPNCPSWPQCNGENKIITDIPRCVIDAFKSHNFIWGGDFKNIKDTMHFEWHAPVPSNLEETLEDNEDVINREEGDEIAESDG